MNQKVNNKRKRESNNFKIILKKPKSKIVKIILCNEENDDKN